jgi:DNA-binding response OmpR family regulator
MLVEDDHTIGSIVGSRLQAEGHDVTWVATGHAALEAALRISPGLVLLDLGLPDLDGIELCRRLRVFFPEAVIVVVTARDEEMDVVEGLEAGADDYLTKPLRFTELGARVRAHLRRIEGREGSATRLVVGGLTVDPAARRAEVDGHDLVLRAKEFDLLARLAQEPGVVVRRETLMSDVWDEHWSGSTKTLDVHIVAVRRKLVALSRRAPVIETVRGYGYRLEAATERRPHPESAGSSP